MKPKLMFVFLAVGIVAVAKDAPTIEGKIVGIVHKSSWELNTKSGALFGGNGGGVKATLYRVETSEGEIVLADRAGSIFHGFPKRLFEVGDSIRMSVPKDTFWRGQRVKVVLPSGKKKGLYVDSDAREETNPDRGPETGPAPPKAHPREPRT